MSLNSCGTSESPPEISNQRCELSISTTKLKSTSRGKSWATDTQVTEAEQVDQNQTREAINYQRICKPVRTFVEWVLMETINWIANSVAQFSRGRLKWSSHRKLRRCKSSDDTTAESPPGSGEDDEQQVTASRVVNECENAQSKAERRKRKRNYPQPGCRDKSHEMNSEERVPAPEQQTASGCRLRTAVSNGRNSANLSIFGRLCIAILLLCFINEFSSSSIADLHFGHRSLVSPSMLADASLIIGDSAIEIQEVGDPPASSQDAGQTASSIGGNSASDSSITFGRNDNQLNSDRLQTPPPYGQQQANLVLGSATSGADHATVTPTQSPPAAAIVEQTPEQPKESQARRPQSVPAGPLPPIAGSSESSLSSTSGASSSRPDDSGEARGIIDSDSGDADRDSLSRVLAAHPRGISDEKAIAGKVVDFELTPAGGHNKAKIKKKKKKKKKKESEEFKKWGKKKKSEKKAHEKKHKESMKKKKEEGKKGKKKWGIQEKGQKKKGQFKKKKWGKKVKKGKGLKKGKKGKKFLKDKGHKNTGFKTVYHKEEWGKSSKWHDIKREKKWDEKSKKWKKKWKKEKGKKYKGDHMKKFKKEKKSGKKYKKEKKEKFKKSKKEEFKKGKKEKMEEHGKKKEGGMKKEGMKAEKKKKKKKKG